MRKVFVIAGLSFLLVLICSTFSYGSNFGFAGNLDSEICNLQFETYSFDPAVIYVNYFNYNYNNASFSTVIAGAEYFLPFFKDHKGIYIGAGLPLFRNISSDTNTYPSSINGLGEIESGLETKIGCRFSLFHKYPWFDLGCSNIKKMYVNLGFNF